MSEPKYKLGDDGELEEIFDDGDEKPKRKPKPFNRTLHIPLSLMLVLIVSISLLVAITFGIRHPITPTTLPTALVVTHQLFVSPTKTPQERLDQLPLCSLLPLTQKARFVYMVGVDSKTELLRADADGTNSCLLTNDRNSDNQPAWSSDGNKIAFMSTNFDLGESAIYVIDADGRNVRKLTGEFDQTDSPTWSPDGQKIAFSGTHNKNYDMEIYVINADGTNQVNITNKPGYDMYANWSPDGKSIVFSSNRIYPANGDAVPNPPNSYEVYVMSPTGDNLKQLTFNGKTNISPSWSPNGQQILFYSEHDLYLIDKDGSHQRQLTHERIGAFKAFWMPDGKEIGFTSTGGAIQFMNIETGQRRSLTVLGIPYYINAWSSASP